MLEDVPNIIPAEHLPEVPKEEECILFFSMGRSSFDGGVFHKTLENHKIKPKAVYLIYEKQWEITDGIDVLKTSSYGELAQKYNILASTETNYHKKHAYEIQAQKYAILALAGTTNLPDEIYPLPVENAHLKTIRENLSPIFNRHLEYGIKKKKSVKFSINASAGSSEMIISLFMVGVYYRAEIHVTPDLETDIVLPIPYVDNINCVEMINHEGNVDDSKKKINVTLKQLHECHKVALTFLNDKHKDGVDWVTGPEINNHLLEKKCKTGPNSYYNGSRPSQNRVIGRLLKKYKINGSWKPGYDLVEGRDSSIGERNVDGEKIDGRVKFYRLNEVGKYAALLISFENKKSS